MSRSAKVSAGEAGQAGPALVGRSVSYTYPGAAAPAVDAVDLAVGRGERLVVAGPSGSGKSTLARLLVGLLRPTAGSVLVAGLATGSVSPQVIARHAGLVFQNPNHQLLASTVADELALGPKNLGLRAEAVEERVREVAERLDLGSYLPAHPYHLGLALRKRVALAAVLAMRPGILVLDEPTSWQGPADVRMVTALLLDEADRGTAVVAITHDMRFAARLADRLLLLVAGRVHASGPAAQLFREERALAEAGLEAPQVVRLGRSLGMATGPLAVTHEDLVARLRGVGAARGEP